MSIPPTQQATAKPDSLARLAARFTAVRSRSEAITAPLTAEDCMLQSMPEASPTRWHLAHTSWFFETFVLRRALADYRPFDPAFEQLFNSYYESVGAPFPRSRRGLLSRPSVSQVLGYRRHVDTRMQELFDSAGADFSRTLAGVVELGLNHEQQHQELILTDIKHALSLNPLQPVYREQPPPPARPASELRWLNGESGLRSVGHEGGSFAFDNEGPRHQLFVHPHRIATRLVTNGEYRQFIEDRGYARPEFWLAEGIDVARERGWDAPLYWRREGDQWSQFTLQGRRPLVDSEPVCHVSYYEADAFARWANARLPLESEWELAATRAEREGNLLESDRLQPESAPVGASPDVPTQMFGDVWEWTSSAYAAYPGYRPAEGALGEYNGKFMCNQFVLRGGSCVTPRTHIRPTYRNFFAADARWQFSGIRLASERVD